MNSIDELREEIRILRNNNIDTDELVRIADAIERELGEGYVELPRDADGEHIHVGDKLVGKYLKGNPVVQCTRLTLTSDWMVGHGHQGGTANLFAHYKEPTVEDVLREFADLVREEQVERAQISDEVIAEFAERLQLRDDD